MSKELFDSFVKEQFADYRPGVPAHIWENISAGTRKKPVGFWNFFSGMNTAAILLMILVAGGALFYFFISKPGHPAMVSPSLQHVNTGNIHTGSAVQHFVPINSTDAVPIVPPLLTDQAGGAGQLNSTNISPFQKTATGIYSPGKLFSHITNAASETELTDENEVNTYKSDRHLTVLFSNAGLLQFNSLFHPGLKTNLLYQKNLSIPCPRAEKDAAGNKNM